jgi:hypothetical protein
MGARDAYNVAWVNIAPKVAAVYQSTASTRRPKKSLDRPTRRRCSRHQGVQQLDALDRDG